MSTTDGPEGDDIDRRRDSLDREQQAAESSFETELAGQTTGKTIAISPRLAGCGCFGCSSLVFLSGCLVLLIIVGGYLLPDWRVNRRYVSTSCQVIDKKLDSELFDVAKPRGQGVKKQESYRPAIKIQYEVNGRKIVAWTYDGLRIYSPDRAAQQAIVDSFEVGSTCPCWYDPDRPDQAVLVRGYSWGAFAFLIIPIALLILGGLGISFARKMTSLPSGEATSEGFPIRAPEVPRVIQALQNLASRVDTFNPSRFGDPVAMKTEWSPIKNSGGNIRTHRLVEVDPDRLEFRATKQGVIFAGLFLLVGMGVFIAVLVDIVSNLLSGRFNMGEFMALLVGLCFCAVGGYLLNSWTTPVVFDRRRGLFWKGRKEPDDFSDPISLKNVVNLKEIHALQLISYLATRYPSYELNLVMENGDRLNVVVHGTGSRDTLREEADVLAGFLGKPVWDAL